MDPLALPPGTLVFQPAPDTPKDQAISAVHRGWDGWPITHVSLVVKGGVVVEAVPPEVRQEDGGVFWARLRREGLRTVVVGIPEPGILPYLNEAMHWAGEQIGQPYNHTFRREDPGWYCSELAEAFYRKAGAPASVLPPSPLNFYAEGTETPLPFWVEFYRDRGLEVPQGQPGSHPARQSLSPGLKMEVLRF